VGQPRPLASIVRTLTVALAGLANPVSPLGIYLFVGPNGTGKTHTARCVAKLVHGDPRKLVVIDCLQLAGRDDWGSLLRQLAPHPRFPVPDQGESVVSMGPLSVLLVEHLEWARPEMVQALVTAIETGHLMLPDGKCGSLSGCLVLMTSNLCAKEISAD
jgi:ATP-dependent Clp protease ATP-binding subunit ClpA